MKPSRNGLSFTARALSALVFGGLFAALLAGCPKSYPNCDGDSTCKPKGEVCVDNICRQCRDDSQCVALDACMMCQANECVKRPGCCKSNLDCPSGKCWKDPNNPSAPGVCGGECKDNSHCPDGQRCTNGSCVPDVECTDDSFCPSGQSCVDGRCEVKRCEVEPIYFDFNESAIRLDQESVVAANVACMNQSGGTATRPYRAEGHCDERGSDEYNLALGQRRAASVVRQYVTRGVDKSRLSVISYGEEKPVCGQSNESCWRQNRRVETVAR